jgi:hypothetical protein
VVVVGGVGVMRSVVGDDGVVGRQWQDTVVFFYLFIFLSSTTNLWDGMGLNGPQRPLNSPSYAYTQLSYL